MPVTRIIVSTMAIISSTYMHATDYTITEKAFIEAVNAPDTAHRVTAIKRYGTQLCNHYGRHDKDGRMCITTPQECELLHQYVPVTTWVDFIGPRTDNTGSYPETTIYVNEQWLTDRAYIPIVLFEINRAFHGYAPQTMALKRHCGIDPDTPNSISKENIITATMLSIRAGNRLVTPVETFEYIKNRSTETLCPSTTYIRNVDADLHMARNTDAKRLFTVFLHLGIIPRTNAAFMPHEDLATIFHNRSNNEQQPQETVYADPHAIANLLLQ